MVSLTFNCNLSSWHVAGLADLLGDEAVTVAYYNPPLGENYHGVGILPEKEIGHSITAEGGDLQFNAGVEAMDALISSLKTN